MEEDGDDLGDFKYLVVVARGRLFYFLLRIMLNTRCFKLSCIFLKHKLVAVCSFLPTLRVASLDMPPKIIEPALPGQANIALDKRGS